MSTSANDDRWSWAHDIWRREFAGLAAAGYALERVDRDSYWQVHEAELRAHYEPEVFFDTTALRTEHQRAGQERLAQVRGARPLRDFCIVRQPAPAGDRLVGVFSGYQSSDNAYHMHHTHLHPEFRGRGIYKQIVQATIAYTGALGFDTIVSEHAPGNNRVLVAKLKAGFRIDSMYIDPMLGVSIRLHYFHNPDHLAAYHYRCGLATLNPRILATGFGALPKLLEQLGAPQTGQRHPIGDRATDAERADDDRTVADDDRSEA